MAVKEHVEKRVEKAKENVKVGLDTAIKIADSMSTNMHKNVRAVAEFLDDREIALTLRFNKLTIDGEISKTLSCSKRSKK